MEFGDCSPYTNYCLQHQHRLFPYKMNLWARAYLCSSCWRVYRQVEMFNHMWGRWVLNGYFIRLAHFSWDIKHVIGTSWSSTPNQGLDDSPHKFWISYEYLIHYQILSHRSRRIKNHAPFLLQNACVHTLSVFEEEESANTNTSITNAMGDEEVHNEKWHLL